MKLFTIFVFISTVVLGIEHTSLEQDSYVEVKAHGAVYKIKRDDDPHSRLTNTYAKTSRPSPPFFIEPFNAAKNVETYGELEVLSFLEHQKGIFIDARLPNWYERSIIPSAINIPFKLFLTESAKRKDVLQYLGITVGNSTLDFSNAKMILLYCNGAWCGQSPTAIKALIKLGYPPGKIKYYRGGMQSWQLLGLTTIIPQKELK